MFGLGATELVVILVIVLLLFGAGRVSGVMKDLGKGVKSFKEGVAEAEDAAQKTIQKKPSKKTKKTK